MFLVEVSIFHLLLIKKMFKKKVLFLLLLTFANVYAHAQKFGENREKWIFSISLAKANVLLNIELKKNSDNQWEGFIDNQQEKVVFDRVIKTKDSLNLYIDLYDAALLCKYDNEAKLRGDWVRFGLKEPFRVPLTAEIPMYSNYLEGSRLNSTKDWAGKWEIFFEDNKQIIGEFKNLEDNSFVGTFLSSSGDYRFLEGFCNQGVFYLFGFNGASAYIFIAEKDEKTGNIKGEMHSGRTGYKKFTGKKNAEAFLPDANKITYLKEGYKKLDFSFPNLDNQKINLSDKKFKNKVVIVQLLGSWCPNCIDEIGYLSPWYQKNKKRGVEIIGLAYERNAEFDIAKSKVEKIKKKFDIQYELLIAGTTEKENANATLPMLNGVNAYPTTIFIDKKGKVRKIHTGFSGPATGKHYEEWQNDFNLFIDTLLAEK
ncbi:MAG: TlpA family protein disulfide reductase [Bacteroidetes bacterium]|nr:MAG: TlpA family protein disulfide reductase [Bacteroidota bacterium]TAG86149.1 MAG: TlpA family protein disulfide reductase [Bacteroidota bacterium]